jgi:hypothetical protein
VWLTFAQVAGPLAAGVLTRRWDPRFHLSAVLLAALLFSPLCWAGYLPVALVPLAVLINRRAWARSLVMAGRDPLWHGIAPRQRPTGMTQP